MIKALTWLGVIVAILVVTYLLYFFLVLGGPENVRETRQALTEERFVVGINIVRIGLELYRSIHGTYPDSLSALDADPLIPEIGPGDIAGLGATVTYEVSTDGTDYDLCVDSGDPFTLECFSARDPLPY